jgi:hypothetical protein
VSARRRSGLAIAAIALAVVVVVSLGRTASNTVPVTYASDTAESVTADSLKPAECAGITLTALVYGGGTVTGGAANELIVGSGGVDTITANGGDDCVLAGGGADTAYGGAGADVVLGAAGNDRLEGGADDDTLDGGADSDICLGDGGSNTLINCEQIEVVELLSSWVTGTSHASVGGSNRALVVVVGHEGASMDLINVTYGTVSLTQAVEVEVADTTNGRVEIWVLDDAGITAASDSTIGLTWSGSPGSVSVDSAFFAGVDQASTFGATGTNTNVGDTPTTLSTPALAASDGDLAVYGIFSGNAITFTPLNAFTEGNDQQVGTSTLETGYKESRGPSETPSADADAAPRRLAIAGVILNGAPIPGPSAVLSGSSVPWVHQSKIVAGGETGTLTLTNETWDATVGEDNAITTALINGIDSDSSEATGWDAVVKANMDFNDVTRISDTIVTITLAAEPTYAITSDETITVTIPASALSGSNPIVATPTFDVRVGTYYVRTDGNDANSGTATTRTAGPRTRLVGRGRRSRRQRRRCSRAIPSSSSQARTARRSRQRTVARRQTRSRIRRSGSSLSTATTFAATR